MLKFGSSSVVAEYPKITAAMSALEYSPELEAKYTFFSTFGEKVCGAIRQGNILWVPRESVPYAKDGQDFRTAFSPSAIDCTFEPRHEQGPLCEQSLTLLKNGRSHIFEAPTGWGKSLCEDEEVVLYSGQKKTCSRCISR